MKTAVKPALKPKSEEESEGRSATRTKLPQTPQAEATFWGQNLDDACRLSGMEAHFVMVTPELADAWLRRNTGNRKPSPITVERYSRDMNKGKWLLSSQAITFSDRGRLLNGQNRLLACAHSKTPFPTVVIFGLSGETFINEDTARKRSRKDRLDIQQEERSQGLSDVIGWLYAWEKNRLGWSSPGQPTPAEEQEILERYPRVRTSVSLTSRAIFNAIGKKGMLAMLHYVMGLKDETMADAFFDAIATGGMIRESDPVYQLRKRLLEDRTSSRKLARVDACALVIKAWNLHRRGREIQMLVWRAQSEPFPEIE